MRVGPSVRVVAGVLWLGCGCSVLGLDGPVQEGGEQAGTGGGDGGVTASSSGSSGSSSSSSSSSTGGGSSSSTGGPLDGGPQDGGNAAPDAANADAGPTDLCPNDPLKDAPGVCGCGIVDADGDNNGVVDCLESPDWTNLRQYLVPSDGTHGLGTRGGTTAQENLSRDQGSKLLYFDPAAGDNTTAEVLWWNGTAIVDSTGSPANTAGQAYGTDPLNPNLVALKPFAALANAQCNSGSDLRVQSHGRNFGCLARNYPDWFLFRRGQSHTSFNGARLEGGRSESQPLVVAGYGPLSDGRAVIADPGLFTSSTSGETDIRYHVMLNGLAFAGGYSLPGAQGVTSLAGGPVTVHIEDCAWLLPNTRGKLAYLPMKATVRRSVVGFSYNADDHNQGFFASGYQTQATFDEDIFYKNGYKSDPLLDPDPRRDIFSRNVYQGGGAQMGHVYRNVIFADGASGAPQMRLGGLCENSLVVEGYWFSATESNGNFPSWLPDVMQAGQSAVVRNNVQLVLAYPTPNDPDTNGTSDTRAQPGFGYTLQGASFGAVVEGNIISSAMLRNDLGASGGGAALTLSPSRNQYPDGAFYSLANNTLRNNILYRTGLGLSIENDWLGATGVVVEDNAFVSDTPTRSSAGNLLDGTQLNVRNNRFYGGGSLPGGAPWVGTGNTQSSAASAASAEGWPDPDRTLKRYVTEVLGLTLLDWMDDPAVDPTLRQVRVNAGEAYDPTGLKTFMAVAVHMRRGGADAIPSSGKPAWAADYPWDARFTAASVVTWIRAGFGLPAVP